MARKGTSRAATPDREHDGADTGDQRAPAPEQDVQTAHEGNPGTAGAIGEAARALPGPADEPGHAGRAKIGGCVTPFGSPPGSGSSSADACWPPAPRRPRPTTWRRIRARRPPPPRPRPPPCRAVTMPTNARPDPTTPGVVVPNVIGMKPSQARLVMRSARLRPGALQRAVSQGHDGQPERRVVPVRSRSRAGRPYRRHRAHSGLGAPGPLARRGHLVRLLSQRVDRPRRDRAELRQGGAPAACGRARLGLLLRAAEAHEALATTGSTDTGTHLG